MIGTPRSLRLHIGIFGRMNTGKSSFVNMIAGQEVSIVSPQPGTTTDIVEKSLEIPPLGPAVLLDTAGIDDSSELGEKRTEQTRKASGRTDVSVVILEPGQWTESEETIVARCAAAKSPLIAVINKCDLSEPTAAFLDRVKAITPHAMNCTCTAPTRREEFRTEFRRLLIAACPEDFLAPPPLVGDLLPPGGLAALIVPIDLAAPKGRLILPQVQTIRDALDNDAACLVVKEREYAHYLATGRIKPDLAICDSQVVLKMTADTPSDIPCTTFSILFSRMKGDLPAMAAAAAAIDKLHDGDRVLIAEACSHHAVEDDIGRVKIPRWLRQYAGAGLTIDTCAGRDFPADLGRYKLVVHCGSCMLTRRETLLRLQQAREAGVPLTNYGIAISFVQGVLERVLSPFPAALEAFREATSPRLHVVEPPLFRGRGD